MNAFNEFVIAAPDLSVDRDIRVGDKLRLEIEATPVHYGDYPGCRWQCFAIAITSVKVVEQISQERIEEALELLERHENGADNRTTEDKFAADFFNLDD